VLTVDVFSSVNTNTGPSALCGYFILNYESDLHAGGEGAHNHTTFWKIWSHLEGAIAGDTFRSVATPNQRTPNLPETSYFIQGIGLETRTNMTGVTTGGMVQLLAAVGTGEHDDDGWVGFAKNCPTDGEFGYSMQMLTSVSGEAWDHYPNDPHNYMEIETARVWRWMSAAVAQWSMTLVVTYHSISYAISGTVSGSSGGTVNIMAFRNGVHQLIQTTTRIGNGAFSIPWYDNTIKVYCAFYESDTLVGITKPDFAT
jgi:hypothetical protein